MVRLLFSVTLEVFSAWTAEAVGLRPAKGQEVRFTTVTLLCQRLARATRTATKDESSTSAQQRSRAALVRCTVSVAGAVLLADLQVERD